MSAPKDTSTSTDEGPAKGPSPSGALIGGAVAALNSGCWQERDALSIAEAVVGERSLGGEYDALIALMPDELQPAVRDALPEAEASPNPQGLMWIVRQADGYRRDLRALDGTNDADGLTLPPPHSLGEWMENPPRVAPPLIDGVLRQGGMMLITAASKAGKSWLVDDLAIAVASGTDWLGMPCRRGRVLLIDFELDPGDLASRMARIIDHRSHLRGAPDYRALCSDHVDVWCLRDHPVTTGDLCRNIEAQAADAGRDYSLVVCDPLYSLLAGDGADENSATAVGRSLAALRACMARIGSACALPHHHPKGASGSRDALDRGSGSGVIGRFGDAVLDLSRLFLDGRHQANLNSRHRAALDANGGDDLAAYRLTFAGIRSFRAPRPLDLVWTFPAFTTADPADHLAECGVVGSDPVAEANARRSSEATGRHDAINAAVGDAVSRIEARGEVPTKDAVFGEAGIEGMSSSQFSKMFDRTRNGWFGFTTERASGRQWRVVPRG